MVRLGDSTALTAQTRVSQHAVVAELGQAALQGRDVSDLFDLALELVCEALTAEFGKVLRQTAAGEPLLLVAGRGWSGEVKAGETTVPCSVDSQAGFTLLSDNPVRVVDLAQEERFTGPDLLIEHGVTSGISVVIPGMHRHYGVIGVHTTEPRLFSLNDADFLRSVANILGSAVLADQARHQISIQTEAQARRLRYQAAIAKCAQTLLGNDGDDRLEDAVEALLEASQATYVFVERNVMDDELGFCSKKVADAEHASDAGNQRPNDYWDLVPWAQMPTSRAFMEKGKAFHIDPALLEGIEYDLYAADPRPVQSELDMPIFVAGEWAGLVGFADTAVKREWNPDDYALLTTAATMIGAFWEREASRESLHQLVRSKDDFLASVSHELRTPLTAVVGFGRILRDSAHTLSDEERAELLETVVEQGTDLTNIVNDLLAAAKADIGALRVALVPVNLRAQAAQVLEVFESENVEALREPDHPVRALGDPDRVRQILRNLLSNAFKYGGDSVRVEVASDDMLAHIRVSDNGDAIPEEDRERIFEPYQRAHRAPGLVGSLGLGLAISRQLAQLMGGDLSYRHEKRHNVFELSLPIAR